MIDTSLYTSHIPVMLEACMRLMDPQPGGKYADGTLGAGGHSEAILKASSPDGQLISFDLDPAAIAIARERLEPYGDRVRIIQDSYVNLGRYAEENSLDGFIVDLGVSSMQLDRQDRGFSFLQDGPLDMRFSPEQPLTAADLVNQLLAITDASFKDGGKKKTVSSFLIKESDPDTEMKEIERAVDQWESIIRSMEAVLPAAVKALKPGGRLLVISFHSLEDRIVKNYFKTESKDCLCPPEQPVCTCGHKAVLRELTRHTVTADDEEIKLNPRARSAKLRAAVKI